MTPVPSIKLITALETVLSGHQLHASVSEISAIMIFSLICLGSPKIAAVSGKSNKPVILPIGKRTVIWQNLTTCWRLFRRITGIYELLRPFSGIAIYSQICHCQFLVNSLTSIRRTSISQQCELRRNERSRTVRMSA